MLKAREAEEISKLMNLSEWITEQGWMTKY